MGATRKNNMYSVKLDTHFDSCAPNAASNPAKSMVPSIGDATRVECWSAPPSICSYAPNMLSRGVMGNCCCGEKHKRSATLDREYS